jgi:hypothetical protein
VPEWRRALGELLRVARSTVVFDFPPTASVAAADVLLKRAKRLFAPTWTHRTFRIGDVRREVERHGWRVVAIRKDRVLPVALHRKLDDPARSERLERLLERFGLRALFGAPVTFRAVRIVAPPHAAPRREETPMEVTT